jgi:hypothetical protein
MSYKFEVVQWSSYLIECFYSQPAEHPIINCVWLGISATKIETMWSSVHITYRFITLALIFFLNSRGLVFAQAGTAENIAPIAENFCWTQECKAEDSSLYPRMLFPRKEALKSLADQSGDPHSPGFYSKADPATERNARPGFFNDIAQIQGDQNPVPVKLSSQSKRLPTQYDLFRNENKKFSSKFLRGTALVQGSQAVDLVIMLALPDSYTRFSCNSWAEARRNLGRAWSTPPVWDKDPWATNLLFHPYAGSVYYNILRSQGASPRASFLFSTGESLFWEYVVEAVVEQPSIQDILATSTIGSVWGELSHRAVIRMGQNGFSTLEKIVAILIDPAYVINNGFRKRHPDPPPLFHNAGDAGVGPTEGP